MPLKIKIDLPHARSQETRHRSPIMLGISTESIIQLVNSKLEVWLEVEDTTVTIEDLITKVIRVKCKHCAGGVWTLKKDTPRPLAGMLYHIALHERSGYIAPNMRLIE